MGVNIRKRSVLPAVIALALVVAGLCWLLLSRGGKTQSGINASPRPPEAPPLSIIEHVAYRKTSEFDPGTIRVYLRNTTGRDMRFEKVLLDGLPIPVWGVDLTIETTTPTAEMEPEPKPGGDTDEHKGVYESAAARFSGKRILWAKLSPASIPPGGIGEFSAKLVNPLPRPMKVEFVPKSGDTLSAVVRPVDSALRITAITFAEDLKRIYIYMEGMTERPLDLLGLELNGEWVGIKPPEHDKVDSPSLWLSSQTLTQGEKQLAIFDLTSPLTQGDYITIRVLCHDDFAAEERVRVFAGFPLNRESGSGLEELGMDASAYTVHPHYASAADPEKGAPSTPLAASLQGNYLFCCQMHRFGGDRERCALETIRRHLICERFDPQHPSFSHLCRLSPEIGYALFAETSDILRINPNITSGMYKAKGAESPDEIMAQLTRYAVLASRPRPVHSLADTASISDRRELSTPEEFRRKMYAALGCGIKGLFYRYHGGSSSSVELAKMNEEIKTLNAEIRAMRDLLSIADGVDWVDLPPKSTYTAYSLLAGNKAVILIVVPKEQREQEDAGNKAVSVPMHLSRWLSVKSLAAVAPGGLQPLDAPARNGFAIEVTVPAGSRAGAWVIGVERAKQ